MSNLHPALSLLLNFSQDNKGYSEPPSFLNSSISIVEKGRGAQYRNQILFVPRWARNSKIWANIGMRRDYNESQKAMISLGRILKDLREDLGLSLRRAAKTARVSPAHLCKLERGETFHSLGIHVLLRLAETYQVPLSSVLKMAGFIEESDDYLPPLSQYLRMKFRLPPQAIRDIEIAKMVVETKYNHSLIPESEQNRLSKLYKQGRLGLN